MAYSKVRLNGDTLIDLTQDTVASSNLISPNTAHGADGQAVTGGLVGAITYEDLASSLKPSGDVVLTGTRIENYAFAYRNNCPSWTVHAPNCTYVGTNAFRQCNTLTEAHFPSLTTMHNTGYVVYQSANLEVVDWGSCDVRGNTFTSCSKLATLILRKTTVQPMVANNVFNGTPFASGGSGGTIYIPKVLYDHLGDGTSDDYKAATNWATYDGYGTITWAKIEGSSYELST